MLSKKVPSGLAVTPACSSLSIVLYNPKAFVTHAALLRQAFAHCAKFPTAAFVSFFTALIFLVHPMHTEVVANIKSLDEILALLFSVLFLNSFLSFHQIKNFKTLLIIVTFLLLALLSKESSVILLAIAPIAMYVFTNDSIKNILLKTTPILIIVLLFTIIRITISDIPVTKPDIMDDP